ncbi:hypothetical protein D6789_04170 [Candidatus Woesearchaeota archaeon]|nr:MAG: hypothetical protein D6789_04170 [Candidatus Woesearchaeota archaeon]
MENAKKILIKDVPKHAGERVNVMGVVVNVGAQHVLLDDKTGQVAVKIFGQHTLSPGQPALVMGVVKDGRIIATVIRRLLSPKWLAVRALELSTGSAAKEQKETTPATYETIIETIRALDKGDGAALEEIYRRLGSQVETLVMNLLAEGEVFENRPGRVKVLD